MATAMPGISSTPIKTYNITNPRTFRQNRLQIQNGDQTILWTHLTKGWWSKPCITLHSSPPSNDGKQDGPVLAACRLHNWSRNLEVCLGDPDAKGGGDAAFDRAESMSWSSKAYRMNLGGRSYEWRRTHRKELGASRLGSRDFKLVDVSGDVVSGGEPPVLAVFVHTQSVFGKMHEIARVEYFVELGPELELTSMAVMLGIQELITRQQNSSAGAAGGAGA